MTLIPVEATNSRSWRCPQDEFQPVLRTGLVFYQLHRTPWYVLQRKYLRRGLPISPAHDLVIRTALPTDLPAIHKVDLESFPRGEPDQIAAQEGELEMGVLGESVLVAELSGSIRGYLQFHQEEAGDVFLSGIAVLPEFRRYGIGRALFDALLTCFGDNRPLLFTVTTSVSPENYPMLQLVQLYGFSATTYVSNYFGPGADRLVFRLDAQTGLKQSDDILYLPVGNLTELEQRLRHDEWMMVGLAHLPHGLVYELRRYHLSDRATVMANEANVSVAFSSVIIAVLGFLTGFGFVRSGYPADLLCQQILALIVSTLALVIYANSSGELSALHFERFGQYMAIGNILSEFGGVYPILQVVPVTVVVLTHQRLPGAIACFGASVAILLYQKSPFDILDRYNDRRLLFAVITGYLVLCPIIGYVCDIVLKSSLAWSILNIVTLAYIGWVCVRRVGKVDPEDRPDSPRFTGEDIHWRPKELPNL